MEVKGHVIKIAIFKYLKQNDELLIDAVGFAVVDDGRVADRLVGDDSSVTRLGCYQCDNDHKRLTLAQWQHFLLLTFASISHS